MKCITCRQPIHHKTNGFTVCPHCQTLNAPRHKKLSIKNRSTVLLIPCALAACVLIAGVSFYTYHQFHRAAKPANAISSAKQWDSETAKLEQAKKLVDQGKLDEASAILAQIDKKFPAYSQVADLQKTIEVKRAEIAKQLSDQQSRSGQPAKKPAPTPAATVPFSTPIQIRGDTTCQSATTSALQLLSQKAPSHYTIVTKYIGIIECVSQGSGIYAYENSPRYLVGNATRDAGTVWYAGTIAHDAGHSELYHQYLNSNPGTQVPDSVWTGESAEKTCLAAQADALSQIGGTQSQIDYVNNIISSQYYNVPYDQRWW